MIVFYCEEYLILMTNEIKAECFNLLLNCLSNLLSKTVSKILIKTVTLSL